MPFSFGSDASCLTACPVQAFRGPLEVNNSCRLLVQFLLYVGNNNFL